MALFVSRDQAKCFLLWRRRTRLASGFRLDAKTQVDPKYPRGKIQGRHATQQWPRLSLGPRRICHLSTGSWRYLMDEDFCTLLRAVEAAGNRTWGRNYAMPCPKCQHTRRRHRHARPLSITRLTEGILFHCWHCGWKGLLQDATEARPKRKPPKKHGGLKLPAWI